MRLLSPSSYYPILALSDFYLSPKKKTDLRDRNFGINEGVLDAVNEYLGDQDEDFYFEWISKLEQRWRKCIKMKADILKNSGKFLIPGYSEVHEALNILIIPFLYRHTYARKVNLKLYAFRALKVLRRIGTTCLVNVHNSYPLLQSPGCKSLFNARKIAL